MNTVSSLCITFIIVLVIYWVMPTKKMKAVNVELKSLLQILPITKLIESIINRSKNSEKN
jgi:hypothetical protein